MGKKSSASHYIGSATLTLSLSPSLSTEPPNINTATGYRFLCRVSDDGREHQQGRQVQRTPLEMLCQLITPSICFLSRSSLSSPPPGNVRCISSLLLCILIQCSSFISRFLIYECSLSPLAVNMRPPVSRLSLASLPFNSTFIFLCISLGWSMAMLSHGNAGSELATLFFVALSCACVTYALLLLGMWYFASGSFPLSLAVLTYILPSLNSLSPPCSPLHLCTPFASLWLV